MQLIRMLYHVLHAFIFALMWELSLERVRTASYSLYAAKIGSRRG